MRWGGVWHRFSLLRKTRRLQRIHHSFALLALYLWFYGGVSANPVTLLLAVFPLDLPEQGYSA